MQYDLMGLLLQKSLVNLVVGIKQNDGRGQHILI